MLQILENENLSKHNTFAIGGPARYFAVARSKEDILEASYFAREKSLPFFVLGGGSNILISDEGYNGVMVRVQIGGINFDGSKLTAGAGVLLSQLVNESVNRNLSGLEWAVGIPGTIGGAVNGNCGAYGKSVSESVESVMILKEENGEWQLKKYSNEECFFRYRGSRFKHPDNKEVILEATLDLGPGDSLKSREEMKNTLIQRRGKIPTEPSAGCVFKNVKNGSELVAAAGKLIEQCGLKETRVGNAFIPAIHGNYIVNGGNAKAADVRELMAICKERVKEKFGITLEEEIILI
ncbi:UDP-N-acetylmuramate dehydrogenase [Candidatus Parcubacteria bacterium]|nr:MAG: UDP-N-acetylmuramate dehydrogenase [Candidatus Parcubacteria bacterium]